MHNVIIAHLFIPVFSIGILVPLAFFIATVPSFFLNADIFICKNSYSTICKYYNFYVYITALLILSLRCLVLPVLYSNIQKKSKNQKVVKLINNLNTNIKYRIFAITSIFFIELFAVIILTYIFFPAKDISIIELILINYGIIFISADLLLCYIILFLWWDIKSLLSKHKNSHLGRE